MNLEQLREYLKSLEESSFTPGVGFRVQTPAGIETLTAEQLRAEIDRVTKEIDRLAGPGLLSRAAGAAGEALVRTEEERAAKGRKEQIAAGQRALASKDKKLVDAYTKAVSKVQTTAQEVAGLKPSGARKTEKDLARAEKALSAAETALNNAGLFVAADGSIVRRTSAGGEVFVATGVPTGVTARQTTTTAAETSAGATTTTGTTGGTGAATTAGGAAGTTGATGGAAVTTGGVAGTTGSVARRRGRREVSMDQIAEAVQQFFPNYTAEWLSENGVAHFGQDLIDLFRRVAAPGSVFDVSTGAGRERIRAEIRKTVYWQTTLTAAKNFDQLTEIDRANTVERTKQRLAQTYGNIGLDQTTLNELALNVARNGLTGLGEQQAVYNTVFRVAPDRPAQAQRALEGVDADRIRSLGRAYNFDVTNEQIQSILTGTPERSTGLVLTEDGLRERMQKAVKGAMPQLAEQIDAGLTLEDISRNYRRYAASLLEKSEEEIDMFQGPYLEAFGNREQGQLSLGEWTQKVKSDPRFGWQFTNQANRMAGDIALTIARAFGKVQ